MKYARRVPTESGNADFDTKDGSIGGSATTNENLTDVGGNPIQHIPVGLQTDFTNTGSKNVNDVSDFLARPVELDHYFLETANHYKRIPVWNDLLMLPSVRAKLRNYAFLKGTLHVRVSISANQFIGGRVLLSYQPYVELNQSLNYLLDITAITSTTMPLVLNYLSQAEGSVVIDIRDNTPIELTCPFISPKPMNRLFDETNVAIATPFPDFVDSGDLFIYVMDINEFGYDSTNTLPYVQVYAWIEDAELGTDTATQLVVPTEAGKVNNTKVRKKPVNNKPVGKTAVAKTVKPKTAVRTQVAKPPTNDPDPPPEKDERETGPVESISSGIVEVATAVEKVSWLAPFATPVKIAAGAVGSIASLFGWSRPIMMSEPSYVKPISNANTSYGIGGVVATKLTLDPEQELVVDASAVAIPYDQLIISSMADRTSFLTSFVWTPEDTPLTTDLFACSVHPNLVSHITHAGERYVQPTAMSFASQPFQYWRGDIVFRFDIVTNSFVKGKIAVVFEPNIYQLGLITTNAIELNKQFITVVDLQETQTFEVVVKWAGQRPWLKNVLWHQAWALLTNVMTPSYGDDYCNGAIYVTPFTALQGVAPSTEVKVLVSVRAENLHVNCINADGLPYRRKIPTESASLDETCMLMTKPIDTLELNESTADDAGISKMFFGEEILSFRTALKRYALYARLTNYQSLTNAWSVATLNHFPKSNVPFGAVSPVRSELFTYLRYAFLGYRGSTRHIMINNATNSTNYLASVWADLSVPAASNATPAVAWYNSNTELPFSVGGACLTMTNTNSGIEFEIPYYSNNLFSYSCTEENDDTASEPTMDKTWYRNFTITQSNIVGAANGCNYNFLIAAGEDFTFLRFLGSVPFSHGA